MLREGTLKGPWVLIEALVRSQRIIIRLFLVVARVSWIVVRRVALLLIWMKRMGISDFSVITLVVLLMLAII